MPVFEDLMQKRKGPLPKKDGTLPEPVKAPVVVPVTTMRVRMLRTVEAAPTKGRDVRYAAGQSVDLPLDLACAWVRMGLAEEDKMLDGPKETK